MGKLEKGVVLGVLFLISVIMVLSISTGEANDDGADLEPLESRVAQLPIDRSPETSTPLERSELPGIVDRAADAEANQLADVDLLPTDGPGTLAAPGAPGAASELQEAPSNNVGLLNSSVGDPDVTANGPIGGLRIQSGWDLKSVAGLERSPNPSFLIHVCARGETYEGLARKLYADVGKAELLRRNNEGLTRLEAGLEILVPVSDDRGPDAGDYVVQDGESLWVISKRFYGKGSRWGEIFEANRDLLTSPESVRKGMTLRIP